MEKIELIFTLDEMKTYLKKRGYTVKEVECYEDSSCSPEIIKEWVAYNTNLKDDDFLSMYIGNIRSNYGIKNQFTRELKMRLLY